MKEVNEIKEVQTEEVAIAKTTQESGNSKVANVVKKHGKTALKVIGVGALTLAAFALGTRYAGGQDDDDEDYIDVDFEIDDVSDVDDE